MCFIPFSPFRTGKESPARFIQEFRQLASRGILLGEGVRVELTGRLYLDIHFNPKILGSPAPGSGFLPLEYPSHVPGASPGCENQQRDKKTVARGAGVEPAGLAPRCWRPPDSPVTPAQVPVYSRLSFQKTNKTEWPPLCGFILCVNCISSATGKLAAETSFIGFA